MSEYIHMVSTLEQLKQDLTNPETFQEFANSPLEFIAHYGIRIDNWLATVLEQRLAGHKTLNDFQNSIAMQFDGVRPVAVGGGTTRTQ